MNGIPSGLPFLIVRITNFFRFKNQIFFRKFY